MAKVRPTAGGGRAVELQPEQLPGWFERFGARHGGIHHTRTSGGHVVVTAADGAKAELSVPFDVPEDGWLDAVVAELSKPRRIGLILVRKGGHSIGIASDGKVEVSTTDSRQVQGRSKAGGWSQQRFARRREGQARQALHAAADDAVRVLVPHVQELDAVVLGGDRQALETLRADRRLAEVFAKAERRVLAVAEPRRTVLEEAAVRARSIEVVVSDESD